MKISEILKDILKKIKKLKEGKESLEKLKDK
jgi:hypothetical protein